MKRALSTLLRTVRASLLLSSLAVFLVGCASSRQALHLQPPPPLPSYHDLQSGTPIRRIAVLPLCHDALSNAVSPQLDDAFYAELSKTSLFENVIVSRAQMEEIFGRQQISSAEVLPGNLLTEIRTRFGADAVLFTDVTHYFPYQPISIGARTKLVDARSGAIRWAFDYLFDSGKPIVASSARRFYLGNTQPNLPVANNGDSVLMSPLRFSRYVAWETYRSLLNKNPEPGS